MARAFASSPPCVDIRRRAACERLEVDGWSRSVRLEAVTRLRERRGRVCRSLANRLHETLIARTIGGAHLAACDEAREKAARSRRQRSRSGGAERGRSKGEARAKEPSRLERQLRDEPSAARTVRGPGAAPSATPRVIPAPGSGTSCTSIPPIGSPSAASGSARGMTPQVPRWGLAAGRVGPLRGRVPYEFLEIRRARILLGHKPIIACPRRSQAATCALRREKKARRTLGLVFPEERLTPCRSGSERINGRQGSSSAAEGSALRGYRTTSCLDMTVLRQPWCDRVPPI